MTSEHSILRALNLLTVAPKAEIESLGAASHSGVLSMRRIVGKSNVVGVGIADKISQGRSTGKLALTFYVERKLPMHSLTRGAAVPPVMPEAIGDSEILTDVVEVGRFHPDVGPLVKRTPVQPAYSIGHVKISAGTLGAIVSRSGKYLLLSNSHVLANSGKAKKGDSIVYPGPDDSGEAPADVVGKLSDFVAFITGGDFVNRVDCAIAEPLQDRLDELLSEIKGLGVPRGAIRPKRGMHITKVGRTTGKTVGVVRDVHFRFTLKYPGVGLVGFVDQVLCSRYSKPGDSGSLVLDRATGKAAGLHFAGAEGGSVFNPIQDVLKVLGVRLVTKTI